MYNATEWWVGSDLEWWCLNSPETCRVWVELTIRGLTQSHHPVKLYILILPRLWLKYSKQEVNCVISVQKTPICSVYVKVYVFNRIEKAQKSAKKSQNETQPTISNLPLLTHHVTHLDQSQVSIYYKERSELSQTSDGNFRQFRTTYNRL